MQPWVAGGWQALSDCDPQVVSTQETERGHHDRKPTKPSWQLQSCKFQQLRGVMACLLEQQRREAAEEGC